MELGEECCGEDDVGCAVAVDRTGVCGRASVDLGGR